MREVERRDGGASRVAVEHRRDTAYTERAHVHVIVSTDEKLNREDLALPKYPPLRISDAMGLVIVSG